ncbi:hypothetical protein M9434_006306 [Picochlorum sp. BPE23]|nr:hypothetical protein M9434_006306 [Picochlorum sp. BPE23]
MENSREEELGILRERISSLQDASILAALRGLSEKISSQRKLGDKRPSSSGDDLSRLLPSFVSLLDRICRVQSEELREALNKHVRDILVEEIPWVIDVLFRTYAVELQLQPDAVQVIFDALEVDGKERGCNQLYDMMLKSVGRAPVAYQTEYKLIFSICVQRSIFRLKESMDSSDCCGGWWPFALGLASLPLLDSRFRGSLDVLQDAYGIFLPMIENLSHKFVNPEWVVMSIAGGTITTDSLDQETVAQNLDSTVASVELVMQLLVSILHVMDEEERPQIGDANWIKVHRMISKLLIIRWELGQFARAVGYSELRAVQWPLDIGLRLLPFFVESSETLLMTPPQITLVLDMMTRQGKRPKAVELDEESVEMLKLLGPLLEASITGLMHPKKVLFAESTQLFANLAQRTRVGFSRDNRFGALLAQKDGLDSDEKPESEKNDLIAEHDQDVDELLAMISARSDAPLEKRPKKIQPERIDSKPSSSEGIGAIKVEEKPHVSSYHHKGRVIMPATYNLDSETREILWQAYIDDKDKLVEMLGDSNYHQWHDETERPSSRRKSGMDVAFNAIFGESTAQNDSEFEMKNGVIVDDVPKSLIDVSSLFPWQSLISGVVMLASHVVNCAPDTGAKARMLYHIIGDKSREHAVSASLKLLQPDYSRSIWKNCCNVVKSSPSVGCLLYVSFQFRHVAMHTTRHSIDLMVGSFMDLLQTCNSLATEDIHESKMHANKGGLSVHPLDLVQGMVRSCMTFPPLLGSTIDSKSAAHIPDLCGLGEETEVLCYTASCCWVVWQSLQQNKKLEAFWLTDENLDVWSHPVSTARIPAKYQFLTSSLSLISRKIQELAEDSSNIHGALQACSSLCATLCINIFSIFSGSHTNTETDSGIYRICQQKKFNLSLFSVISALCEIYCGLAEDWEDVVLGRWDESYDEFPDAGSIIVGMDIAEACQAYLSVVNAMDPKKIQSIPDTLMSPVQAIVSETHYRMTIIMESIQKMDKQSDIYKRAIKEIQNTPDIIIVDKDSHGHSKRSTNARGKTVKDIQNPFVRAIVQESGRKGSDALDDDVSDLEDFIVADPGKDYEEFIADHFPLDQSSNDSGPDDDG